MLDGWLAMKCSGLAKPKADLLFSVARPCSRSKKVEVHETDNKRGPNRSGKKYICQGLPTIKLGRERQSYLLSFAAVPFFVVAQYGISDHMR